MTREDLLKEQRRLADLHHDAFLVEFLGAEGSGLTAERIGELVDAGLLSDEAIESARGMAVKGTDLHPYEVLHVAGVLMDEATPKQRAEMRGYSLSQWLPLVELKIEDLRTRDRAALEAQGGGRGAVPPAPPIERTAPMAPQPPSWMSPAESAGYERALTRAGEYIRGLGNRLNDDLAQVVAEQWAGEQITQEVDPVRRQQMLDIVRNETARTLASNRDARALAGTLADRSQYYAHNWQRIAVTELQGAHNEGRVQAALSAYGEGAQVARIPESGACRYCEDLFTEGGAPKVFKVADLLGAGVNVGRSRSQWQATLWPMHPNCRCDTITVPPGFIVTKEGALRRAKD